MKIIDLLNKIANGEEVPKKIKVGDTIWVFKNDNYVSELASSLYLDSAKRYLFGMYNFNILNNEYEVINED